MKHATYQPPRSELRVADLKARVPSAAKLMNVKIPNYLADAITQMARSLNVSKNDVVVALLNEGLAAATHLKARK